MNDSPNLVTTYTFKEKLYLVKMYVLNGNTLELSVTDKFTAEEWRCSYDATYIENLTHKTGNYKQFDVFVTMLKSGLLKTSECVALDLLTVEDLESLRSRRIGGKASFGPPRSAPSRIANSGNRRYIILTYSVEFDRIHYPLPLEYCGPPDPQILQGIIRKLEADVERLQEKLQAPERMQQESREEVIKLQKRVEELSLENKSLVDEVHQLNKKLSKRASSFQQMESMQIVMKAIEEQVVQERTSFRHLLHKLRDEKARLQQQVELLRASERGLRGRLRVGGAPHPAPRAPGDGLSPPAPRAPASAIASASAHRAPPPTPTRGASESPRKTTSNNHHPLTFSRSATCCHTTSRHHRSSSASTCNSQKVSPSARKLTGGISSNALHPTHMQPHRTTKPLSARTAHRSERNTDRKKSKHQRSCSECSSCSRQHSCSKRNRSGSWSSSASSRAGQGGSGDRKHTRRPPKYEPQKQNKDVKRGMSDLEERIKALQKLLKEGLPIK